MVFNFSLLAQDFDYHRKESPAITWNGTPIFDARMLAAGGVSYFTSRPFAAAVNPALLPGGGKFNLGVSGNYMSHSAFQYWGINEGVLYEPAPITAQTAQLSGAAFSFPLKNLRLSAGWYLPVLPALPSFNIDERYWAYRGDFSGREDTFFAAAAFKLGAKLDIGVKVDYVSGKRDVVVGEYYKYYMDDGYGVDSYLLIQRRENHSLSYLVSTIGAAYEFSPSFTLAAALAYPFKGKARRTLTQLFDNFYDPPITYTSESEDTLYRPAKLYLTAVYIRSDRDDELDWERRTTLVIEPIYVFWSGYRYVYFAEEMPRGMRNCLILAAGWEYGVYRPRTDFFFRAGYRYDPQPLRTPAVVLHTFSIGGGLRMGRVTTDFGFAFYISPAAAEPLHHFALTGTLGLDL